MQVESPTPAGTPPGIMPLLKPDHVSELAGSVYVRLDKGVLLHKVYFYVIKPAYKGHLYIRPNLVKYLRWSLYFKSAPSAIKFCCK